MGASRIEVDAHRFGGGPRWGRTLRVSASCWSVWARWALGVEDPAVGALALHVRTRRRPSCGGCGGAVWLKGTSPVRLVDLTAFGRPVRLVWHKWRWRCPAAGCLVGSFTEVAEEIAPARSSLTSRAGRWATMAVGRDGCPVSDVAAELGYDWHTVNRTVAGRPNWALLAGLAKLPANCRSAGFCELLTDCEAGRRTVVAAEVPSVWPDRSAGDRQLRSGEAGPEGNPCPSNRSRVLGPPATGAVHSMFGGGLRLIGAGRPRSSHASL